MTTINLSSASISDIHRLTGYVERERRLPRRDNKIGQAMKMIVGQGAAVILHPFELDHEYHRVTLRNWEYAVWQIVNFIPRKIRYHVHLLNSKAKTWKYRAWKYIEAHPWYQQFRREWRMVDGKVMKMPYSGMRGSFMVIEGKTVKVDSFASVIGDETAAASIIGEAKDIVERKREAVSKAKVRDAEFFAMSGWGRRFMPRSSEEIAWGARNS